MTRPPLIRRSLRHYWRQHLTVGLATAVAGTVLVGALLVGGSVRQSLDRLVFLRLGQVRSALVATDLLPRADLAERLRHRLGAPATAVLALPAVVTVPGSDRRAGLVQACGVDTDFPALSPYGQAPVPAKGTVILAASLAHHLAVGTGDVVVIRLERLSGMPKDTPLARTEDAIVPLRLTVAAVADERNWARFGLRSNHTAPLNAFVNREELATALGIPERANLILSGSAPTDIGQEAGSLLTAADASLDLRELPGGGWEARSPRVFLASGLGKELSRRPRRPTGILTYLANSIEVGDRATPYSFVTGTDAPWLPQDLGDDGIVLNEWLATDLRAAVGDRVRLRYYVLGTQRNLDEAEAEFTVRQIVPLTGPFADPDLMPDFPGIAGAKDCTDWETGADLDFGRIRPQDEAYWEAHRGTPKAFVSLARAQQLWGNRFGNLTAIRFRERDRGQVEQALVAAIPSSLGCALLPVWEDGLTASEKSADFGGLFLGLSFFLIVAALLLTALLYSLGLEPRREQIVTLRAVGWSVRRVRLLLLREAFCVALPGVLLGVLGGLLYNALVIRALTTVWSGSVGRAPLAAYVSWPPVLIGVLVSLLVALLALYVPLRRSTRGVPRAALECEIRPRRTRRRLLFGALLVGSGLALVLLTPSGRGKDAAATFFGAGSLLLIGALTVDAARRRNPTGKRFDAAALTQRGASRSPTRSLAVEGILAAAVFLTVAVGANRHGSRFQAEARNSGTGGFAFYGETAVPVFDDLAEAAVRDRLGLAEPGLDALQFVPFGLLPGDEASCLNLNQPQHPNLLGVDPTMLDERHAFRFAKLMAGVDPQHPWLALDQEQPDQTIPAIADDTVITWALRRGVGETFTVWSEDGRLIRLRFVASLANSVLQGSVVIGQRNFQRLFPAVSGSRVFLVDAPGTGRDAAADRLRAALRDQGLELTPCAERLAQFATVENTYLAIFLALGGLALLLGGVGLGLVLVRNMLDRRAELALFRAVGFRHADIVRMLFLEHAWLFLRGLTIGALAGIAAVLPAITTPGSNPALGQLAAVLLAVLANGLVWIWFAARRALRAPLVPALRTE